MDIDKERWQGYKFGLFLLFETDSKLVPKLEGMVSIRIVIGDLSFDGYMLKEQYPGRQIYLTGMYVTIEFLSDDSSDVATKIGPGNTLQLLNCYTNTKKPEKCDRLYHIFIERDRLKNLKDALGHA